VEPGLAAAAVPAFAVQHLVENAVRHGIAGKPGSGLLSIAARRQGEGLVITVSDDGAATPGADFRRESDGGGLANTRDRLRALYGERADLRVVAGDAGGAVATLTIPYHEVSDEEEVGETDAE